jgi:2-hydroxychromene-2-carboxylate isomerase
MDIEFWYDFSSPWTYLASTQLESVVQGAGGNLIWRPMLLGAVFKQVGTPDVPALAMPEPKRNYYSRELDLWAEHWNVPFASQRLAAPCSRPCGWTIATSATTQSWPRF